jgi:hypothetical protein
MSLGPVGGHALAYLALSLGLASQRRNLPAGGALTESAVSAAAVLALHVAMPPLLSLAPGRAGFAGPAWGSALASAAAAAILGPLMFAGLRRAGTGWTEQRRYAR